MKTCYSHPQPGLWTGRASGQGYYLHEKVAFATPGEVLGASGDKRIGLVGYACDEGVRRNQGRPGARSGPDAIRSALGRMPNHLSPNTMLMDLGSVTCEDDRLETTQEALAQIVTTILGQKIFPLCLGGGHDIAYGHHKGLRGHYGTRKTLGIVNLDAHFDLRATTNGPNSGTPFYQIHSDCEQKNSRFAYCCIGIRKDANDMGLFKRADSFGVTYLERDAVHMGNLDFVLERLGRFVDGCDLVQVTVDLDGFASAYAPGVSAASPMGFAPDIALECLGFLFRSNKVVGLDIAEMNPAYDHDGQTAKLAASILHFAIHHPGLALPDASLP